ncbi:MAG: DUF427 domain-containing protein [Pseudomonadota bacterium]
MSARLPRPDPIQPGSGQESVWSFPRPAIAEPSDAHIRIEFDGRVIAETRRSARVIETSHPPAYYVHPDDFDASALKPNARRTLCEWKGPASYFDVVGPNKTAEAAAWRYPTPVPSFQPIAGYIAVYPQLMDACFVNGERATPQDGAFYGGWITNAIVGPFKGPPGTEWW